MSDKRQPNNIDYVIWAPNDNIYIIPYERMEEFKLEKDSPTYIDISTSAVAKATQVAAAYLDDNGDWQPFGATCFIAAYASAPDEVQPEPGDNIAYINLDFDLNNTFDSH